jgi:hypothetical protein
MLKLSSAVLLSFAARKLHADKFCLVCVFKKALAQGGRIASRTLKTSHFRIDDELGEASTRCVALEL